MVTEKSPKKFRFTLVTRLQNYCLDIIENLLMANILQLTDLKRLEHQKEAGRLLEMLGYFEMLCMETTCILTNQFENISKLQAECRDFLEKIRNEIEKNQIYLNLKSSIISVKNGVEFLGWRFYFSKNGKIIQKIKVQSKKRIFKKIKYKKYLFNSSKLLEEDFKNCILSYKGYLLHGNG